MEQFNKWTVLASMCLLTIMLNLDATAVNLAIPSIAHNFQSSLASTQWVINAFLLFAAMFQIYGSHLGERYERRSIFLFGTIIFVVGSALAGFASNLNLLIIARILQGIALGIAYPVSIMITNTVFPKEEQGKAMGVIMGVMGLSLALGPTIGGVIIQISGWPWIFYINIPIGILTLFLTLKYVPKIHSEHKPNMDISGTIVLMSSLFFIVLALNQSQEWGIYSLYFISCLILGCLLMLLLYYIEKNRTKPIVDFQLFKNNNYSLNCLIRLIAQMVFIPVLFFVPLYLINILGFPPLHAGITILALTIIIGISSPFVGHGIDLFGDKIHTLISCILFVLGIGLLLNLSTNPLIGYLSTGLIFIGFACGINFVSTTVGALGSISEKSMGVATGVFFTIAWVSCSLAISVCGAILGMGAESALKGALQQHAINLDPQAYQQLLRLAQGLSPFESIKHYLPLAQQEQLAGYAYEAFMSGFKLMLVFLCVCSCIGIVLSILIKQNSNNRPTEGVLLH